MQLSGRRILHTQKVCALFFLAAIISLATSITGQVEADLGIRGIGSLGFTRFYELLTFSHRPAWPVRPRGLIISVSTYSTTMCQIPHKTWSKTHDTHTILFSCIRASFDSCQSVSRSHCKSIQGRGSQPSKPIPSQKVFSYIRDDGPEFQ